MLAYFAYFMDLLYPSTTHIGQHGCLDAPKGQTSSSGCIHCVMHAGYVLAPICPIHLSLGQKVHFPYTKLYVKTQFERHFKLIV